MQVIFEYAAERHGIVSRTEALALGLSKARIDNALRSGKLRRVAPKVFSLPGVPDSWTRRTRIAALSVGGLASHRTAAYLHGLESRQPCNIEVVVSKVRRPRSLEFVVHRSTRFHLADATEVGGVPVTGLARTVLDLGAVVSPQRLEWAVDAALRQNLCEWHDLVSVLQIHSIQGRNGCGPLRALLEARDPGGPIPDSAWNRMVGQLLRSTGLPEPDYEHVVGDGGAFIARVDLAYPHAMLAIELDSMEWHMNRESFEKDPRRKNKLIAAGWTVLSFTWADYRDRPQEIVHLVATSLRNAS